MSLKEQQYANLNRNYFHGYHVLDPKLKTCEEFYLTNSFIYAASYAGRKGHVEVYHLKKSSNIFNLNSETDFNLLKENLKNPSIDLEILKKRDWFSYFKGDLKKRRELLDVIESLGYDGYFNKEVDKELSQHSILAGLRVDGRLLNSPSIGIFNKDCLTKIKTIDNISENEYIDKYKELELQYIEYKLLLTYKQQEDLKSLYEELVDEILNFNSMQIMLMITKFNPKEYIQDFEELDKKFGSIKLLKEKALIYYQRPIIKW